jgi:uncharacterized protein (TIGR02466 family)
VSGSYRLNIGDFDSGAAARYRLFMRNLFATPLYEASLAQDAGFAAFNAELLAACLDLAQHDGAGIAWSAQHGYRGYTSYASLDDLPSRYPEFEALRKRLDKHAAAFAKALAFDLGGRRLKLDSLWVNVLKNGGSHSGHIHPHSVLSGTVYVKTPKGSSAIKFEDPRLPAMMAAPPRRGDAPESLAPFIYVQPSEGTVLMWESWLRHEVPPNAARSDRVSVSFNYAWR